MNSCSNNNWGVSNNSPEETDQLFHSIDAISKATLLDRRFILAILLQETKGCVRVHTTFSADGVRNPGLMQSHNGKFTCNSGTWGAGGVRGPGGCESVEDDHAVGYGYGCGPVSRREDV
jgi:hypothetical protein